ncbi:LOW QUALITY PROTEIN: hypothetical protein MC885_002612, partial [Smutsia gigantea]
MPSPPLALRSVLTGRRRRLESSAFRRRGYAVPSGRPSALVAVTSRPVPSFRCGSLVSPLGAGSPHLRRRGSRLTGGTPRARGRPRWWEALSLWRCLGHRHQKADSALHDRLAPHQCGGSQQKAGTQRGRRDPTNANAPDKSRLCAVGHFTCRKVKASYAF